MPEALAYSYSGIGLHVGACGEGLLIETQGYRVLVSSVVDSGFSNEGNDVVGISFEEFLE